MALLLLLATPTALEAAGPSAAVRLAIRIDAPETARPGLPNVVMRVVPQGERSGGKAVEKRLKPGETGSIELPGDAPWRVRAQAEGFWIPEILVDPQRQSEITLRLFPTGELRAEARVQSLGEAPGQMEVRFEPAPREPGASDLPSGTTDCPVTEGFVECSVPVGTLDLRFAAPPFAPVYRLDVRVGAEAVAALEPLSLARGSSVMGEVMTEAGAPPPRGTVVKLELAGLPPRLDAPSENRLSLMGFTTGVGARGFFQFRGVQPGTYAVTAEAPGYAPATVSQIRVLEDLETSLVDPLVLAPPATVELRIDPPRDLTGKPWEMELRRLNPSEDGFLETVHGTASGEGEWRRPGLTPGTWEVEVRGSENSRWAQERIHIYRGMDPVYLELPLVQVTGTLFRGDDPAPGTLWFGTRHGGRRVRFEVDEDGDFEGVLPAGGDWDMEWAPVGDDGYVGLKPIEVPARPRVELALRVPDTLLEGVVVDEDDRAVPDAEIKILSLDGIVRPSTARTDEEGRFSLPGLEPGAFGVSAASESATSDMVAVSLAEGRDTPDLRIVLRTLETVAGWIRADGRGVPGARIIAWPALGDAPGMSFMEAVSGLGGYFELRAPGGAAALGLLVQKPGFALALTQVFVGPGAPFEVELDPYPGELTLALDSRLPSSAFLVHDGTFLPVQVLAQLARQAPMGEGPFELTDMDPGTYSLCAGPGVLGALRDSRSPPEALCTSGVLPPLGELVLELPPGR